MVKTRLWQKITLILFGALISFGVLEIGMRLCGVVFLSMQEHRNLKSLKQTGAYRILCIGESTTQEQYPKLLERILNERIPGARFSVIDKGRASVNSLDLLAMVEAQLDEYRPNAVVAMMGINDRTVKYYEEIPEVHSWIFQHCRVYKFGRLLWVDLFQKLNARGVPALTGALGDSGAGVLATDLSRDVSLPQEIAESQGAIRSNSVKVSPVDVDYVKLGSRFMDRSDYAKAMGCFKKAIEVDPNNIDAYAHWGELCRRRGDLVEGIRLIEQAIALEPADDNLYVVLGRLHNKWRKDFFQIEALYKKALALNPRNKMACLQLGRLYLLVRHDFAQAERLFLQAMEAAPDDAYIPLELGGRYRLRGDLAQAEAMFKKALEIDPGNDRVLHAVVSFYEMVGRPELASQYAEMMDISRPDDYDPVTVNSYKKLKSILDRKGVRLICVQYPMRNVGQLRRIFEHPGNVVFVDNEEVFKSSVAKDGYAAYFSDMFAGDFGHCTRKGNELLAKNIADVVLREVFHKN